MVSNAYLDFLGDFVTFLAPWHNFMVILDFIHMIVCPKYTQNMPKIHDGKYQKAKFVG